MVSERRSRESNHLLLRWQPPGGMRGGAGHEGDPSTRLRLAQDDSLRTTVMVSVAEPSPAHVAGARRVRGRAGGGGDLSSDRSRSDIRRAALRMTAYERLPAVKSLGMEKRIEKRITGSKTIMSKYMDK
jgi:hypothetical protein